MPQYSFCSLTPTTTTTTVAKRRPRPISKRAFVFGIGTCLYVVAAALDLVGYWGNLQDEQDDDDNLTDREVTPPFLATLASFCYILTSLLQVSATPSTIRHKHKFWWQKVLEDYLEVRAEFTLQILFGMASILLFGAETLKTHKFMRSLRKQQRICKWSFCLALHLFWLSTFGLYKIIPSEDDDKKNAEDDPDERPDSSEGSLIKWGRLFLIFGTTIELSMIYIEYFSEAKVSTGSILLGTLVSALFWWIDALLVIMTERYYYSDQLLLLQPQDDDKIVDFSFEDAMNLPDRLRQRMQAHRRHITHIRVV